MSIELNNVAHVVTIENVMLQMAIGE